MWTEISGDASSVSSELNGKSCVDGGEPHVIAVKIEEPVTGQEYSLYSFDSENHCMLL